MQPFFTTKPTGEGTGLGLSLTYDMVVKGHGGSISVNTKEGEFTEMVISFCHYNILRTNNIYFGFDHPNSGIQGSNLT